MIHPFTEVVVVGVLVAPFAGYAAAALVLTILIRPLLFLIGFDGSVSNPALGLLCIYVAVLAAAMLLF